MDFAEGQEAVAIAAILDERRLQRRFDPCYLREIDIAFERASARNLDVKFFQLLSVDHRNPGFFRVGGVDQHNLGHRMETPQRAKRRSHSLRAAARNSLNSRCTT
jgi:hypothetical protein